MNKKEKLNLIDNYVLLHKCIYDCKHAIMKETSLEKLSNLKNLCHELISLKRTYESTFESLKMMDNSFILLKMQLETAIKAKYPLDKKEKTLDWITNQKLILEREIKKLS